VSVFSHRRPYSKSSRAFFRQSRKGYSPKFGCDILHSQTGQSLITLLCSVLEAGSNHNISGRFIKMRWRGYVAYLT
jgi:hypothetical protein